MRGHAEHVTRVVAGRLADTDAVTAANEGTGGHGSWRRLSLREGFPGVGIVFAELGHHDPAYRDTARTYLDLAREHLVASAHDGLFDGLAAVAFTARAAGRAPAEYEPLVTSLEQHVNARANALVYAENKRTTARRPGADPRTYGLTDGLTGIGAYLLTARRHTVADVLASLVALVEPVTVDGQELPGWWVSDGGYLDLGMAHGISGTLALFALAWRDGIRVTGQEAAMRRVAEWLVARSWPGDEPGWPGTLTTAEEVKGRPRGRRGVTGWCHGTPGVARALQLTGMALDVPDWRELAVTSLARALDHVLAVEPARAPEHVSLCHGWSGLLQLTRRTAADAGDERLAGYEHRLAERVLAEFDPAHPFGFRHPTDQRDRAGFLYGAAGVALALHAYATDATPASGWDRALLLA